jgi:E3 ubiquitin-protein ligase UBR4
MFYEFENREQLSLRLIISGMYVVCTKSIGFNLEVTSNDASMVITGVRICLGTTDATRAPSFIQV